MSGEGLGQETADGVVAYDIDCAIASLRSATGKVDVVNLFLRGMRAQARTPEVASDLGVMVGDVTQVSRALQESIDLLSNVQERVGSPDDGETDGKSGSGE